MLSAAWSHVYYMVGRAYHIYVVLYHKHRIALIDKTVKHIEQHAYIIEMQTGGGLVEYEERIAGVSLGQLIGQFDTLVLATRQR